MAATVYIVVRYWPGGKVEYLGASVDEELARRFAVSKVVTDGSTWIAIQSTQTIDEASK